MRNIGKLIGENITEYMHIDQISNHVLSVRSGVAEQEIENVRNGGATLSDLGTLLQLCNALDVSLCDLFELNGKTIKLSPYDCPDGFIDALCKARERNGISIKDLAHKASFTPSNFNYWHKINCIPDVLKLQNIIEVLRLTPEKIKEMLGKQQHVQAQVTTKQDELEQRICRVIKLEKQLSLYIGALDAVIHELTVMREQLAEVR